MIEFLRRSNLGLKATCLALAVLLYFVANNQLNPQSTMTTRVRPQLINLSPDLIVIGDVPNIPMLLSGPTGIIEVAQKRPIRARVNMAGAQVGRNTLPVDYDLPDGLRRVAAYAGEESVTVSVVVERRERAKFDVDALRNETAIAGFRYAEPVTTPRSVVVSGRRDLVRKVARVIADVQDAADRGKIDRTVALVAQDDQRRVVDDVTITPANVRVVIDIEQELGRRKMYLGLEKIGEPADGYELYNYALLPAVVRVRGTEAALEARGFHDLRVDVSGLSRSTTRTVRIVPPAGVILDDSDRVRVRLDIRRIAPVSPVPRPETGPIAPTSGPTTNAANTNPPTSPPKPEGNP